MDMSKVEYDEYLPIVEDAKIFSAYLWLHMIGLMLAVEIVRMAAYLNPFSSSARFCSGFGLFVSKNIREEGVNKKAVRFFDTLGQYSTKESSPFLPNLSLLRLFWPKQLS